MAGASDCFHCGEPVTTGDRYTVTLEGRSRPVCCPGCKTVAELIRDSGLADFYDYRTLPAPRPDEDRLDASWSAWDDPALGATVATAEPSGTLEAAFPVEGVRCAACAWLIERGLEGRPGLESVEVNPATARIRLRWNPQKTGLGALLAGIARLGYLPHPGASGQGHAMARRERATAIKRLGVAGIGMMQVMMYAVALYAGAFQGMDPGLEAFLRLVSLVVATPVVLYAGFPFFAGAWRDLASGHAGMDVPVALAIGGAYAASVWHTVIGQGEVYFDSVTMFVFFLSLGRFVEMLARHRTGDTSDALSALLPASAVRVTAGGTETVPVAGLGTGDEVLVRDGDAVPADGTVLDGSTRMDESLLTGEFSPRRREPGDPVLAGSLNRGSPIRVRVDRTGADTLLSGVARLLERAQAARPRLARSADRVARWFVTAILVTAATVFAVWWQIAPDRAFEITLSVLVVTCPCALSLATPTALSAAVGALSRHGLLVARSDALEPLAHVDVLLLDKTGTLTRGKPEIRDLSVETGWTEEEALARAAGLEAASGHPLAQAFSGRPTRPASHPETVPGAGVEARIDGVRHRIGRPDWVAELAPEAEPTPAAGGAGTPATHDTRVALASAEGPIARFEIGDTLRPGVGHTLDALRAEGIRLEIVSGDATGPVAAIADATGIDAWQAGLDPAGKLARLEALRAGGHRVAMLGDGVNDAPVLAGADVSLAMGSGTTLAQTSADLILLGRSLAPIALGHRVARRTLRVIRQNLAWAAGYNALAMPAAALGWVQPWMAAIGMSLSSLVVVLNAARLGRLPGDRGERTGRRGRELAEAGS